MLEELLPIRGVTVRLRFRRLEHAPFFHHPQLRPFLKELLEDKAALDAEAGLWVEAVNSGVTHFRAGDEYRFNLFCLPRALPLFQRLIDRLRRLPGSYPRRREREGLFGGNLEYQGLLDYFTGRRVHEVGQLFHYDRDALEREWRFWRDQTELVLRFTSPARLKRQHKQRDLAPYINDRGMLNPGETERRVWRALCNLAPKLNAYCRKEDISYHGVRDRLFWTDNAKTLKDGRLAPFGGVLGDIRLSDPVDAENPHLPLLILGQYLGIGERRGYGLGRYRLLTPDGQGTLPPRALAQNHRERVARVSNFELACYNMARKHKYLRKYIDHSLEEFDPGIEEQLEDNRLLNTINLHRLARRLREGRYRAPELQGVILRRPERHPRPLAIPPLEDRIVQRAVVEVLGQDIDQLSTDRSYGYRRGHSRMQARDRILALNRQGYKWFFEADITEFFDLVSHDEIRNRLLSFFPDEPLVELLMDWVSAPVRFEGRLIRRSTGLPQGSPVSPMLANLLLEDFDADIESRGMKLVRFADDFVILCKTRHQARAAARQAAESLAELGLEFNPAKTGIGHFVQGFDFLGYSFIDGMAVENHRPRHGAEKLRMESIPAASWLAQLLDREPELLDDLNNRLDKKRPLPRKTPETRPLPASEQGGTLLVTPPAKYLHQTQNQLEIRDKRKGRVLRRVPWNDLAAIVLYGRHTISLPCQLGAMAHDIPIHFCTATGRHLGLATRQSPGQGAGLWLEQARVFAPGGPRRLPLCRALVAARLHNQITVLRQRLRHDGDADKDEAIRGLRSLLEQVPDAGEEQLRGYEGQAAVLYYQALRRWVPEAYGFQRRNRRPPRDPFNALLSLGYSTLYSQCASLLQVAGLYPWQGFYHHPRDRHMALASDLMESYRHLVERTALTMLRAGQLKEDDFYILKTGACQLSRRGLRAYLHQLEQRLLKPMLARDEEEPQTLQEHMLMTAHGLIRYIRSPGARAPDFFRLK